jgi:hypothetical protein
MKHTQRWPLHQAMRNLLADMICKFRRDRHLMEPYSIGFDQGYMSSLTHAMKLSGMNDADLEQAESMLEKVWCRNV